MTRRASITTLLTVSLTLMPLAICGCTGSGVLSEGDTLEQDSSSTSGSAPSSTSAGSTDDGESAESGRWIGHSPHAATAPERAMQSVQAELSRQVQMRPAGGLRLRPHGVRALREAGTGRAMRGHRGRVRGRRRLRRLEHLPRLLSGDPISVCVELCVGTAANSSCPQPGDSCVHALNNLYICPLLCDPLIPGQCPSEQTCVPDYADNVIERFFCFPSTPKRSVRVKPAWP